MSNASESAQASSPEAPRTESPTAKFFEAGTGQGSDGPAMFRMHNEAGIVSPAVDGPEAKLSIVPDRPVAEAATATELFGKDAPQLSALTSDVESGIRTMPVDTGESPLAGATDEDIDNALKGLE